MENFVLLGVCFVLGILLRVIGVVDEKGPTVLNAVIIHLSLPALALLYTHSLPLGPELLLPAGMAWIVFGVGYAIFALAGRRLGLDRKTSACLCLCGALGNTSFVGLPMIEAFYGHQYLGVGMLCDMAGTFLVLSVPGIIIASRESGGGVGAREVARKVVLFPPFLALVLGFALQPVPYPAWAQDVLARLGSTLTPLALLSVGMTLRFRAIRDAGRGLVLGLGYKLVLAPALILGLYMGVLGHDDMVTRVTVFEAAMGPMITGGIIAMTHGLRPTLAATMLGLGIPLSFLTLPVWYWLIQSF